VKHTRRIGDGVLFAHEAIEEAARLADSRTAAFFAEHLG
jgi:hypothetical protein